MRISEKRSNALYGAIHEQITSRRIKIKRSETGGVVNAEDTDTILFHSVSEIYRDVCKVLNIPE